MLLIQCSLSGYKSCSLHKEVLKQRHL